MTKTRECKDQDLAPTLSAWLKTETRAYKVLNLYKKSPERRKVKMRADKPELRNKLDLNKTI